MIKPTIFAALAALLAGLCLTSMTHASESRIRNAERPSIPASLVSADRAYKTDGADAFVNALLQGSSSDDTVNRAPMLQQAQAVGALLMNVETLYGHYKGMELIGVLPIADSTWVVYYVLNYERGPVFGVLSVYKTNHGEIITGYAVNTELHKIVPPTLFIDRVQFTSKGN